MINRALTCALVMALILASFALAKKTDDPDDDYFRVRDRQTSDSRTSAVVNPKKSPLPVGPAVTSVFWNETAFAYFGGWGQLVSSDVHHFYIDTETISRSLSNADRKKPVFLQLQQRDVTGVHVELFMSNGEYPTPGKHKFYSNTKDSMLVTIKLPPLINSAHWLIRVQPSEPISVWSKSLEYSLRLYEHEISEADTFSQSWTGFIVTFVVVLGATIGLVWYLRAVKLKEREKEIEEKRKSGIFRNLNTDQELMPLSEAQAKAKEGKLSRHDSIAVSRSNSDYYQGMLESVVRRASPEHNLNENDSKVGLDSDSAASGSAAASTKPSGRPTVFTRQTPPATTDSSSSQPQNSADASSSAPSAPSTPSTSSAAASNATNSTSEASKPKPAPVGTMSPTKPAKPTSSAQKQVSPVKPASNVKKMAAFWANTNKG